MDFGGWTATVESFRVTFRGVGIENDDEIMKVWNEVAMGQRRRVLLEACLVCSWVWGAGGTV